VKTKRKLERNYYFWEEETIQYPHTIINKENKHKMRKAPFKGKASGRGFLKPLF
jgi:hypothetical protein